MHSPQITEQCPHAAAHRAWPRKSFEIGLPLIKSKEPVSVKTHTLSSKGPGIPQERALCRAWRAHGPRCARVSFLWVFPASGPRLPLPFPAGGSPASSLMLLGGPAVPPQSPAIRQIHAHQLLGRYSDNGENTERSRGRSGIEG